MSLNWYLILMHILTQNWSLCSILEQAQSSLGQVISSTCNKGYQGYQMMSAINSDVTSTCAGIWDQIDFFISTTNED